MAVIPILSESCIFLMPSMNTENVFPLNVLIYKKYFYVTLIKHKLYKAKLNAKVLVAFRRNKF